MPLGGETDVVREEQQDATPPHNLARLYSPQHVSFLWGEAVAPTLTKAIGRDVRCHDLHDSRAALGQLRQASPRRLGGSLARLGWAPTATASSARTARNGIGLRRSRCAAAPTAGDSPVFREFEAYLEEYLPAVREYLSACGTHPPRVLRQ